MFSAADADKDGQLTLEEFTAFMNPELHIHMVDVVVDAFLEQFDNNEDGHVSFYEYMSERERMLFPSLRSQTSLIRTPLAQCKNHDFCGS